MQFFNNLFNNDNNNNRDQRRQRGRRSQPRQATPTYNQSRTGTTQNSDNDPNVQPPPPPPRNPFEAFAQAAAQAAASHMPHGNNPFAQEQQQPSRAPPPACPKAIRQLPLVSVTPEDLVDENNRECCICFEEHNIHDKVIRLPCAHIYHPQCITQWLVKHCTCPVCRYELPTDNVVYERERKKRMKNRKPRYAKYELERMNIKGLRDLCHLLKIATRGLMEKKDFVDVILKSDKIIIIAAPEPVEYQSVEILRCMGVGQLKRAMKDAGVFFDSRDVVEKEDMVQIFLNSGRIVLVEKEEEDQPDTNTNVDPYGNFYNTNEDDEELDDAVKRAKIDNSGHSIESVSHEQNYSYDPVEGGNTQAQKETGKSDNEDYTDDTTNNISESSNDVEMNEKKNPDSDELRLSADNGNANEEMSEQNEAEREQMSDAEEQKESEPPVQSHTESAASQNSWVEHETAANSNPFMNETPSFASRGIGELRQLASSLDVDISGCIEKKEIVDLITNAISNTSSR